MTTNLDEAERHLARLREFETIKLEDPLWTVALALGSLIGHLRTSRDEQGEGKAAEAGPSDAPLSLDICTVHQLVAYNGSCYHCGGDRNLRRYDLAGQRSASTISERERGREDILSIVRRDRAAYERRDMKDRARALQDVLDEAAKADGRCGGGG